MMRQFFIQHALQVQNTSLFLDSMQMIMHEIIQSFVNIHIAKIIQADMLP